MLKITCNNCESIGTMKELVKKVWSKKTLTWRWKCKRCNEMKGFK